MEQVCEGWETLKLSIPGGDWERTLVEVIHGYIIWDKCCIILKATDQGSRPASPQPPSWFTFSATVSATCTGTLSFTIISWAAVDSCYTTVSWSTSSATAKEAKTGVEVASII